MELKNNGFGAIELCGAFDRDFALELIELVEGKAAISYSEPEDDTLFHNSLAAANLPEENSD